VIARHRYRSRFIRLAYPGRAPASVYLELSHFANMSNTLPDLPYAYDALEPYISRQIMTLHHQKHHQTYVNALNAAEQAYAKASTPKERIGLQAALKFNGGGKVVL
jgi:hypothetical protein